MRDSPVLVRGKNRKELEILSPATSIIRNSFYINWTLNQQLELHLTLIDDLSVAYSLADIESSIFFDSQEYIVKQCIPDYSSGIATKEIIAVHIYSNISRIRTYKVNTGTLTYGIEDVLNFYLDGNNLGYRYFVKGNFDRRQITDLGNGSGTDMLSQILSTWENAIIWPDNKVIGIYTPETFYQKSTGRFDYMHNLSEVKLTKDSTSLCNSVMCYGKKNENDTYFFEPFIVEDSDSIKKWGRYPGDDISDERFTDKQAMKKYALSKLVVEPIVSVEVAVTDSWKPVAGETRRLQVLDEFATDVNVVGYTWYPFDDGTATTVSLNNVPISILNQNANLNKQINRVQSNSIKRQRIIEDEISKQAKFYREQQLEIENSVSVLNSVYKSLSESQKYSESINTSQSISESASLSISEFQSKSLSESVSQVASESASKSISTSEIGSEN